MSDRRGTGRAGRRLELPLAMFVTGVLWIAAAVGPVSAALQTVDRTAVIAAMPAVIDAGVPSFLFRASDETGDWSMGLGVADLKKKTAASPDAAFRIGSISKTFVAVTVLKLVAAGEIGLDEPVETYLPGLLTRGADITIRDLLDHRSGLRYVPFGAGHGNDWYPAVNASCRNDVDPVEEIRLADVQLSEPGTTFAYSNANYSALGLVIDKVTGQPYEQVIADLILHPLGLGHTSFQEGVPTWPSPYLRGYGNFLPGPIWHKNLTDETDCKMSIFGAAGSGISTTSDLMTFMKALTHGQLLPDELYQQMTDFQPAPDLGPTAEYGLGISRVTMHCGTVLIGHGGGVWGYQDDLWTTSDLTRTFVGEFSLFPGTDAMFDAIGRVYELELCPTT
jgi:D-alanyl-D-alanine carboxypeptidase